MPPRSKSNSSSKPTPRRKKAIDPDVPASTATLGVSDLRQRLMGLEDDNAKLLKLISRKRKEIDNFTATLQDVQQKVMANVGPMITQMQDVDSKIHEIFQQIFATRKMGKQTARMVRDVYMSLQLSNLITFNPNSFDDEDQQSFHPFGAQESEAGDDPEDFRGFGNHQPEESHARHDNREETRQLRQVFLRLATVFHPDKTVEESLRAEYAEVMKEVNLAYQRGDLARLLAIEKQYQLGATIDRSNADDLTLRCQQLARENQLLQEQKLALNSELRQMKSSMAGLGLGNYKQMQKMGIQPIDTLIQQAQAELDDTIQLRDFVQSFLDKKITVAEFRRGPQYEQDLEDFDIFEDFAFFR